MKKHSLGIFNLRVTYKRAKIPLLERLAFGEPPQILRDICSIKGVDECILIQTCHRVEIYYISSLRETESAILDYWCRKVTVEEAELEKAVEKAYDLDALHHLLRLASGLESMVVGEDQILGQLREAYLQAKNEGMTGPILETAFNKAIRLGSAIRARTGINKGAASIGAAAIDLAERVLKGLGGKIILLVGAGEIGALVGKALAGRGLVAIIVANRTHRRAVRLAGQLGGEAARLDGLGGVLPKVDLVVVATSAPHYILRREVVERSLPERHDRRLTVIDLGQPRNVEETVGLLPGVELFNIDDLKDVVKENLKRRLEGVGRAEELVAEELQRLSGAIRRVMVEPVISNLYLQLEQMRKSEYKRTANLLRGADERQLRLVEDLTRVLIRRALHHPALNLRRAVELGDVELVTTAQKLFGLEPQYRRGCKDGRLSID